MNDQHEGQRVENQTGAEQGKHVEQLEQQMEQLREELEQLKKTRDAESAEAPSQKTEEADTASAPSRKKDTKKKKGKWIRITLITLVSLAVLLVGTAWILRLNTQYEEAMEYMHEFKYDLAESEFRELGIFRGASKKADECRQLKGYSAASWAMTRGEYAKAEELFLKAGDTLDAAEKAAECARLRDYTDAKAAMEAGNTEEAREMFLSLGDFRDAPQLARRLKQPSIRNAKDVGPIRHGLAWVETESGKYGYCDASGEFVISPQFDWAYNFEEDGKAEVEMDGHYGMINKAGSIVIACVWDSISSADAEGRRIVKKGEQYGLIDREGQVLIEPVWSRLEGFSEGLALAKKEEKGDYGYINASGEPVTVFRFNYNSRAFQDGYAVVCDAKSRNWGMIDKNGKVIFDLKYQAFYLDAEKQKVYAVQKTSEAVIMDLDGNILAQAWTLDSKGTGADRKQSLGIAEIGKPSEGRVPALLSEFHQSKGWTQTYCYLNTVDLGLVVFPSGSTPWMEAEPFAGGRAIVRTGRGDRLGHLDFNKKGKYGVIDTKGNYVIEPIYESISYVEEANLFVVKNNGKYALFSAEGKALTNLSYDTGFPAFHAGVAKWQYNTSFGYVDASGKLVIPCWYQAANDFDEETGLAFVQLDGIWRAINTEGKQVRAGAAQTETDSVFSMAQSLIEQFHLQPLSKQNASSLVSEDPNDPNRTEIGFLMENSMILLAGKKNGNMEAILYQYAEENRLELLELFTLCTDLYDPLSSAASGSEDHLVIQLALEGGGSLSIHNRQEAQKVSGLIDRMKKGQEAGLPNVSVQDIVTFGHYEQDGDLTNGKEPVEWMVLAVEDGKALLLSRYGLEAMPYDTSDRNSRWATCTLRKWLNSAFMAETFTEDEEAMIQLTNVSNQKNETHADYVVSRDPDTQDRVYLLSYAELKRYIPDEGARRTTPTRAAKGHGVYSYALGAIYEKNPHIQWWVRSPSPKTGYATVSNENGSFTFDHYQAGSTWIAVRPVLWVNLMQFLD